MNTLPVIMNTGSQMPERAFASGRRPGRIGTTNGCPLSLPLGALFRAQRPGLPIVDDQQFGSFQQ
jgi:hypothetical protein